MTLPTTSSRSVASRDRTAHKPLVPFTIDHFRAYTRRLVLDTELPWEIEDFQVDVVRDLLSGKFVAVWTIIPEGNAKSTLMAGVSLYYADFKSLAKVLIAAHSREQAEVTYTQAADMVTRSPGMLKRFKRLDGYRRLRSLRMGGRIQVKAADDATGDGVLYDLALIDELHRQRDLKLYRTWLGKAAKLHGRLGVTSTAGEPGSEFEETRAQILRTADEVVAKGFYRRATNGHTVLHDFAVPPKADIEDMAVVKKANPLSTITEESLRQKRSGPEMTIEHWRRFTGNQATQVDGTGIGAEEWDRLAEEDLEVDPQLEGFGWMDLGWKIDTTAVGVILWESPERRLVPDPAVFQPPVDEDDVVAAILLRDEMYPSLRGWVIDPNSGGHQMAQLLEKGQHPLQTDDGLRLKHGLQPLNGEPAKQLEFIAHSQDPAPMSEAAVRLETAIRKAWIAHTGHRLLRTHVLNAVRKSTGGEKYRFDRPAEAKGEKRKRYPIDCLTGLLMGNNIAEDELDEDGGEPMIAFA